MSGSAALFNGFAHNLYDYCIQMVQSNLTDYQSLFTGILLCGENNDEECSHADCVY